MEAEARFRQMFESTYPVVVRYARHRGFAGQDLEDLVAATYEVAWRRFEQVPAGREALPWLLTVTLNHARNRRRKLSRDRQLLQRLTPPEHSLAPTDQAPYDWTEIRRALDRLSAADRELVLLVAWDGLGPTEAGAVLKLTPAAARTRLHRARARLGAFLQDTDRAAVDAAPRRPAGPSPARRPS